MKHGTVTKTQFCAALRELSDEAYFRRCIIVSSAHNMPVQSYPWPFASVISVASHDGAHPMTYYYNPAPPVDFYARGVRVPVAWPGGREILSTGNSFAAPHITAILGPANKTILLNGRWLAPTVTWLRHFSAQAIDEGSTGQAPGLFLRASWHSAADQLTAISGTSILPRRPALLAQVTLAQRHQIAVPQTIVTTDLGHARRAFGCQRLVIKAVDQHFVEAEPGRLTGIFPTVVERRDLPGGPGPPVVVQEYVEHDAELRVYYAAGRIQAFEVDKDSPAAPWTAPEEVRVRPVDSPAAVVTATRLLASAMALRFAAFDFLIRRGRPVFLEVNPDGDWRWAERMSRTTLVTLAAARMLTELHHEMRQDMPRTVDHGIKPLNLLAFLSGPCPC